MRVNLDKIDPVYFLKREGLYGGRPAVLVTPYKDKSTDTPVVWTQENSIFRSSVWDASTGRLLSASFKKFMNWGESSDVFPEPESLSRCMIFSKLDGSTLLVDKVDGNVCVRTRGSFDFRTLDNGYELDILLKKYPSAFDNAWLDNGFTLVFEMLSDKMKICLSYPNCPDMVLLNAIDCRSYTYLPQDQVTDLASTILVNRPDTFSFLSLDCALVDLPTLKGIEGGCIYFSDHQQIKKIKTTEYLYHHWIRHSKLGSLRRLVDTRINHT
jgi:hypothetical protein